MAKSETSSFPLTNEFDGSDAGAKPDEAISWDQKWCKYDVINWSAVESNIQPLNDLFVINYKNYSEALNSVRKGYNWGILRIPENFSSALVERAQYQAENLGDELTNDTINQSTLVVHADLTNKVLMIFELYTTYYDSD
ncbi:hypothetical protein RND71_043768 [Anisodus tanguticus]|uniref:Uncharacterized protein n=1 Tax=Anisodus tanguticus TaxID=243964 RepID=A0AAE1QQD2_9SOLA|nr:hypothetical protein RND71_043768 [Anisodus tanguticus]